MQMLLIRNQQPLFCAEQFENVRHSLHYDEDEMSVKINFFLKINSVKGLIDIKEKIVSFVSLY